MSYAKVQIIQRRQRLMTQSDAEDYVGMPIMLDKMKKAGWVKPVHRSSRVAIYDIKHLDAACDRLADGEVLV